MNYIGGSSAPVIGSEARGPHQNYSRTKRFL